MPAARILALTALVLPSAACEEFATPADLDRPQVLGLRTTPASIDPGQSAAVELLVVDEGGDAIALPDVEWTLAPGPGGKPSPGTLDVAAGSVTYTAPEILDTPSAALLQVVVKIRDAQLVATKAVVIGGPTLANPDVDALLIDGEEAGDIVTLEAGQAIEVGARVSPAPTDDVQFSWYAFPAEIEHYRSAPTELVAGDADSGNLWVVVRDRGGIAWRRAALEVQ